MTPPSKKKDRTVAVQQSLETGERFPLSYFDSRQYIQHNLAIGDGLGSLLSFIDQLPPNTTKVRPVRAFEDGDISFAHLEYYLAPMGHVVGFEVHRWHDDRIVEHWDNLQPQPSGPNQSGRTMTDGPIESTDHEKTQQNKDLVTHFIREVAIGHDTSRLAEFVDDDDYTEHNPTSADGVNALKLRIAAPRSPVAPTYERLHMVLGEGDFVLAISEAVTGDKHRCAIYDLFRLAGGAIVEHWDVVEDIPPRDAWRNDNGKF